jgi:hypothetical protein
MRKFIPKSRSFRDKALKVRKVTPGHRKTGSTYTGPAGSRGLEAIPEDPSVLDTPSDQGPAGDSDPDQPDFQQTRYRFQTSNVNQQRSQQVFREIEEESWGNIRELLREVSITDSFSLRHDESCKARKAALELQMVQAVSDCCCQRCGLHGKDCGAPWKTVPVTYVSLDFHFDVQVPVWQCTR